MRVNPAIPFSILVCVAVLIGSLFIDQSTDAVYTLVLFIRWFFSISLVIWVISLFRELNIKIKIPKPFEWFGITTILISATAIYFSFRQETSELCELNYLIFIRIIHAIGIVVWATLLIVNYKNNKKELNRTKVKFNKQNIPHYTFAEAKEYSKVHPFDLYEYMVANKLEVVYWSPKIVIEEAYKSMNGVNFTWKDSGMLLNKQISDYFDRYDNPGQNIWEKITKLNDDQLRYLHNTWIDNASECLSFYEWVDIEWSPSKASSTKVQLLARLSEAGVGALFFKVNHKK